jgi:hypothetical protein
MLYALCFIRLQINIAMHLGLSYTSPAITF